MIKKQKSQNISIQDDHLYLSQLNIINTRVSYLEKGLERLEATQLSGWDVVKIIIKLMTGLGTIIGILVVLKYIS